MLKSVIHAVVAVLVVSSAAAGGTWPMYQGNPAHTGYVPVSLNAADFKLRWAVQPGLRSQLNPATAADGKVFVSELGSFDGAGLYAFDAATGENLWTVRYGWTFSVNPPSYADGKVYVQTCRQSGDTWLRAYDAETGAELFRSPHGGEAQRYFAPTIYDGILYVNGGDNGGMYAFDSETGEQRWFCPLNPYDQWTPAVDERYAYAYTGSYAPRLSVVDRFHGTELLSIPDPKFTWSDWSMKLAPVLGSQGNVFAIKNNRLICFDLASRNIRYEATSFGGQPSVANGLVYAANVWGVHVLDEMTGTPQWSWSIPFGQLYAGNLIVTDTHVFVAHYTRTYAINLQTHAMDWSYPEGRDLTLSNGTLYIAGTFGKLTAISVAPPNQKPVCHVEHLEALECAGTTTSVQLDGTASSDPDGDVLTYAWSSSCPGAVFDDPTRATPVMTVDTYCVRAEPCAATLEVSDGQDRVSCEVPVTLADTLPPDLTQLASNPPVLWPPNHKMVPVTISAQATDACDRTPACRIVSVTSSDGPGEPGLKTEPDFEITGDLTLQLRAGRSDPRSGRIYTVTIECRDASGNTASTSVEVSVPASPVKR